MRNTSLFKFALVFALLAACEETSTESPKAAPTEGGESPSTDEGNGNVPTQPASGESSGGDQGSTPPGAPAGTTPAPGTAPPSGSGGATPPPGPAPKPVDGGALVDCECQTFKENRVFITRATFSGNLGGLGGADAKCQQSADAAKLGGRWKAFVSGNGVAAADRFVTDGPWFENGSHALVFANRAAMRKGPAINVNRDEFEADDKVSMYWTGTQVSGAPAANCGSWNSSASAEKGTQGQVNTVLPAWVAAGDYACNTTASLLCLEE